MYMTHSEVIDKLGATPTWVFLPADTADWAPKKGMAVTLIWKNGLCPPVIADFDDADRLIGWDEGKGDCAKTEADVGPLASIHEPSDYNGVIVLTPPAGEYGCADPQRSVYCRMVK